MAPVTLNEPTIMAVRRIDIYWVQHSLCKVQHSSKKPKQRRSTFRSGYRDLKWKVPWWTALQGREIQDQQRWSRFNVKIHVMEKRRPKNFKDPIEVRIAFFGFETIRWRLTVVMTVEITESFVLTGYGSRNSKWDNSYGHPKNRYPQGVTFAVQGAIFVQKAETAPFDF